MELSSSSIVGGQIQKLHACRAKGGADQPLQLSVRGLPDHTAFISILADDPDAVRPAGRVWVHWNVFNIPAHSAHSDVTLAAGQPPSGTAGQTSGGGRGYEGMCPPDGVHTYRFAVFASRDELHVDTHKPWTIDAFEAKYGGQVLAKALITGKF